MTIIRFGPAVAVLTFVATASTAPAPPGRQVCRSGSTPMARVDLFFGAAASAIAWRHFLAAEVTPRFPDGLTVLDGTGQWRGPRKVTHERTHVVIIYYRRSSSSDARIEAIRTLYKARFAQRSVLRADTTACVSF